MNTRDKVAIAAAIFAMLAALVAGFGVGYMVGTHDHEQLPACQFEDGNPDGSTCTWTDKDTGKTYTVDSSNYGSRDNSTGKN